MPYLRIEGFTGVIPKTDPLMLPTNAAQVATNVRLETTALRPWCGEKVAFEPTPRDDHIQTIYRYSGPPDTDAVWLVFDDDVDIVAGPIADVKEFRLYYTSDKFSPRKTNWQLATSRGEKPYPNDYQEMGVPGPTSKPKLSAAGGGDTPVETRAYTYTWINVFGDIEEESAPSPAALVSCNSADDTVTISGFGTPPTGRYNYQKLRIYRSVTGSASSNYQQVVELPIDTTAYEDKKLVAELGAVLSSTYYTPPPEGLHGLVVLAGGFLAGFVGNQVWFSEPYVPHAWPSVYMQTTDYPIVGLAAIDNSLLVMTEKYPYVLSGNAPNGMSSVKLGVLEPCVSKRSITQDQYGVMYASPNGLVSASLSGSEVITQQLLLRRQWASYVPETMFGVMYNNMYIGFYRDADCTCRTIVLHRNENPPMSNYSFPGVAAFVEPVTGDLFAVSDEDAKIYHLDVSDQLPDRLYTWKSKPFTMQAPTSFSWVQVFGDYSACVIGETDVEVRIFADGKLFYSFTPTDSSPLRMPAQIKALQWEVELVGTMPVARIIMATSTAELREII